ncbi:hypothetical protein B0J17DRAFT_719405 [Rhizoctonia solani]|nr:hypothetical protein B0J17DRAFT_719405 [Rhizoctonia solani]
MPRFNSTRADVTRKTRSISPPIAHLVSGLAGIKPAVDTAIKLSNSLNDAKLQVQDQLSAKPPNEALAYLRSAAKSYVLFIPGGSWAMDSIFDTIDELHKTHRQEVDSIVYDAYNDIKNIINECGPLNAGSALAIFGVLRRRVGELGRVAGKASSDAVSLILDRNPKLREALGSKWTELKDLASRNGPETKKVYDDAANEILDTVQSKGVTEASVASMSQIVKQTADSQGRASGQKLNKFGKFVLEKVDVASQGRTEGVKNLSGGVSSDEFRTTVKAIPGVQWTIDPTPERQESKVTQPRAENVQEVMNEIDQDTLKTSKKPASRLTK